MNVARLFVVSAVVMAALTGCDSGPSAPKSEAPAPYGQPAATASPSPAASSPSALPRDFSPARELKEVRFDLDQAHIGPEGAKILDGNARWLKSRRDVVVLINGHADERGTDDYNSRLGERRAEVVKKHLVAKGIEANRIVTSSLGERQPLCSDHKESCWGKNRRAEFQVKPR
jgi:outer membrane protein OmpA-like peptidoglycan-associated protein